jgi:hypothetical protein
VPEDTCTYRNEKAPWWIETFYMDSSGHVGLNGCHLIGFLLLSLVFAFYITQKVHQKIRRNAA